MARSNRAIWRPVWRQWLLLLQVTLGPASEMSRLSLAPYNTSKWAAWQLSYLSLIIKFTSVSLIHSLSHLCHTSHRRLITVKTSSMFRGKRWEYCLLMSSKWLHIPQTQLFSMEIRCFVLYSYESFSGFNWNHVMRRYLLISQQRALFCLLLIELIETAKSIKCLMFLDCVRAHSWAAIMSRDNKVNSEKWRQLTAID